MRQPYAVLLAAFVALAAVHSPALAGWPTTGTPICTNPADQAGPILSSDGAGGMFVIWSDDRLGANSYYGFGARFTPSGDLGLGWPTDGKVVTIGATGIISDMIPDGAGGVFLVYQVGFFKLYVQRLTAIGDPAPGWPLGGVQIGDTTQTQSQDASRMVPDGGGGVYVVWEDSGPMVMRGIRLHGDGSIAAGWPPLGQVLSTPGDAAEVPNVTSDAMGGFFATWWERRLPSQDFPVYACRFTPNGDPYPGWPAGGKVIAPHPPIEFDSFAYPAIVGDGAGGMYCAWPDYRSVPPGTLQQDADSYTDIYGEHVLGDGSIAPGWSMGGSPICLAPSGQGSVRLISDGSGGALAVWGDGRNSAWDFYGQHLLSQGCDPSWTANGSPVATGHGQWDNGFETFNRAQVVTDGKGGCFVAYVSRVTGLATLQHLMADGTADPTYSASGNPMAPGAAAPEYYVAISADGLGGVYAAWEHAGNIWGTHVGSDLVTAIAVSLLSSDAATDHVSLTWLAPQQLSATVERCEAGAAWQTLGRVTTDGLDELRYTDRAVTPGTSYAYRLSYSEGAVVDYTPQTTIIVPGAYTLALSGFRPNPATIADVAISFELPSTAEGKLEMIDVTGRRVVAHDLSGYAAGRYAERIGAGARVAPGIYWLRLTHGGSVMTARGVVLR